jgi:hypothetical protein
MSGISTITAPVYGRERDSVYGGAQSIINRESTTIRQNALIPRSHSPGPIQEPVIEHEHHHVHHHIDHGSVSSVMSRRPKEYYDEPVQSIYERDSRRSSVTSLGGSRRHRRRHRHRDSEGITREYTHTEIDVRDDLTSVSRNVRRERDYDDDQQSSVSRSRRYDDNQSDWTLIDVPPGTRKITLEADERGFSGPDVSSATNMRMMGLQQQEMNSSSSSISRSRGVRRSKGASTELWTEVTKDLVTREAIEELGYPYEETDSFFYIFEYLQKDQIDELIEVTAEIRHERVRELEFKRRLEMVDSRDSRSSFGGDERVVERERVHDHVTEVVYADEHPRRRRGRYYH